MLEYAIYFYNIVCYFCYTVKNLNDKKVLFIIFVITLIYKLHNNVVIITLIYKVYIVLCIFI